MKNENENENNTSSSSEESKMVAKMINNWGKFDKLFPNTWALFLVIKLHKCLWQALASTSSYSNGNICTQAAKISDNLSPNTKKN